MHWLIHAGLRREGGFYALVDQVRRQGHELSFVRTAGDGTRIVAVDAEGETIMGEAQHLVPSGTPCFVAGTTTMKPLCDALGWSPGYVDAPSPAECLKAWGPDALNHDATITTVAKAEAAGPVFIRPDTDGKTFTGRLFDPASLASWRADAIRGLVPGVHPDDRILASSPKTIWSEYRCIVVHGRYVTGSRYKTGRTVSYSPDVGNRIVRFSEALAAAFPERPLLCVDVADTPEGLKAIEANAPSSAGLYAIDASAYVHAVSSLAQWPQPEPEHRS